MTDESEHSELSRLFETALLIAVEAHAGSVDKGGQPYILHVIRVMMKADGLKKKIVATLHDTKEDAGYTDEDFRAMGFPEDIIAGIDALTKRRTESYEDFIKRVCLNDLASSVKAIDLEDNSDISRIQNPTEEDYRRREKYLHASEYIEVNTGRQSEVQIQPGGPHHA